MASPVADLYIAPAGARSVLGGRQAVVPDALSNVIVLASDEYAPSTVTGQPMVLQLHGSGGNPFSFGTRYQADLPASVQYLDDTTWQWAAQQFPSGAVGNAPYITLKPWDRQPPFPSGSRRESYWCGWTRGPDNPKRMHLYTERRLDVFLRHINASMPQLSATKRCALGMSMGAWGCMTYAARRADQFAAVYASRPRVRYSRDGSISLADWDGSAITYPVASAPLLSAEDGGGGSAGHMDLVAYAANTANAMPWIGWCVGRNDGYMPFSDHIAFVAAMRAAKRGFAFAWNDGNHSTGEIISQITASYPYGLFEIGKGYPLFTNHSADGNPAVDLAGGINVGLSFRNVVESASAWSCQVTSILGARTVTVEPKSSVFTASVAPQSVTIPAANAWVSVSFSA